MVNHPSRCARESALRSREKRLMDFYAMVFLCWRIILPELNRRLWFDRIDGSLAYPGRRVRVGCPLFLCYFSCISPLVHMINISPRGLYPPFAFRCPLPALPATNPKSKLTRNQSLDQIQTQTHTHTGGVLSVLRAREGDHAGVLQRGPQRQRDPVRGDAGGSPE